MDKFKLKRKNIPSFLIPRSQTWGLYPNPFSQTIWKCIIIQVLQHSLLYVVYSVCMFITFPAPFHLLNIDKACETAQSVKSVGPDQPFKYHDKCEYELLWFPALEIILWVGERRRGEGGIKDHLSLKELGLHIYILQIFSPLISNTFSHTEIVKEENSSLPLTVFSSKKKIKSRHTIAFWIFTFQNLKQLGNTRLLPRSVFEEQGIDKQFTALFHVFSSSDFS